MLSSDDPVRVFERVSTLLAIIGGAPVRFKPLVDLYYRANKELGQPRDCAGTNVHGFVAATDEEAAERIYPHWHRSRTLVGRDHGWSEPTPEQFVNEVRHGALHPGSAQTVAQKTARTIRELGNIEDKRAAQVSKKIKRDVECNGYIAEAKNSGWNQAINQLAVVYPDRYAETSQPYDRNSDITHNQPVQRLPVHGNGHSTPRDRLKACRHFQRTQISLAYSAQFSQHWHPWQQLQLQ